MSKQPARTKPSSDQLVLLAGSILVLASWAWAVANGSYVWIMCAVAIPVALAMAWTEVLPSKVAIPVMAGYFSIFSAIYLRAYPHAGAYNLTLGMTTIGALVLAYAAVGALVDYRPRNSAQRWMIVLFGMGLLVAFFSGSKGSANGWAEYLQRVFHVTPRVADALVHIIRKSLHFLFYGLTALVAAGWAKASGKVFKHAILFATLWVLGHAAFDEIRQMFHVDRSGSIIDLFIDLMGVFTFLLLYWGVQPEPKKAEN
ncbi:MAG: VanZ family protein [Armatimonadetes bacterium]|nr:VanZ family protein [Armatimonadota bacterium]